MRSCSLNIRDRNKRWAAVVAGLGGLFCAQPAAKASSYLWTGGGTDNNWTDAANWGGAAPTGQPLDNLYFGGASRLNPVADTLNPWQLNNISFDSGAGAFTLSGNQIQFDGGSSSLNQYSSNAQTIQNAIDFNAATTFGGSGTGTVTLNGTLTGSHAITENSLATFIITNTDSYSGSISINNGTFQISGGNGALGTTSYAVSGALVIDDTTADGGNKNQRLSSSAQINLAGGSFTFKGANAAATNSSESISQLNLASSYSSLTVSSAGTNTASLTLGTFTRSGNSTGLINGTNLGGNAGISVTAATGITLVGTETSGTPSTKTDLKIIPYVVGDAGTGSGSTFITYDAVSHILRPLVSAEFSTNAFTANTNVLVTSGTPNTANVTINSLVINGSDVNIGPGTKTLNVTSGAILFASSNSVTGTNLQLNAEGILTVDSGQTAAISATIAGSSGVTKSGLGTLQFSNASNTYTGPTVLNGGALLTSLNASLGSTTTGSIAPLTFNGGTLRFGAAFDPSIRAVTLGPGGGTIDTNTFNVTFANSIGQSGSGSLAKIGTGKLTLSGSSNTYAGPTVVRVGTLALSSSSSNNNIPGSPQLIVGDTSADSGAILDVTGIVKSGLFQLSSGQTLGGFGTVSGTITVSSGSTVSAGTSTALSTGIGDSVGALTTGIENWNGGATYLWKISNAGTANTTLTGNSGAGTSWDKLAVSSLAVTGNSTTPFIIQAAFANGTPIGGFSSANSYSWIISQTTAANGITTNGVTGVNSTAFKLDTSSFASAFGTSPSAFSLSAAADGGGTDLVLSYTPAPEPASLLLTGLSAAGGLLLRRRRPFRASLSVSDRSR
jgi:autotransporter-associated beta strand protein